MRLSNKLLLLSIVSGLSACTWSSTTHIHANSAVATDTLTYQYQTVKQRAGDCGSKSDSGCTIALINYPVFTNQAALNDTVNYRLANLFTGANDKKEGNVKATAEDYIKFYEEAKQQGLHAPFHLESSAKVVSQDSVLLTLQLSGYKFYGANGMDMTTFINWDVKRHKNLTLDDVFVNGYLPQLNRIADTIFRKEENLSPDASLAKDYFFKNGEFTVNHNFLITPLGIRFLYNPAEIKPHAAGQTSIDIPYTKIHKLLQPNTPAALYSK
jgi:hypothetical protein